jgi:putative hydrolase of the HAD superfamily
MVNPDPDTVLLFDLGGVLVENDMFSELKRLMATDATPAELIERWLRNPVARRFELGQCSPGEFGAAIVAELELEVSANQFLTAFASWPKGFAAGVEPLLGELRRHHRVGCLSNSNAVHWTDSVTASFDFAFSSHLIGHIKPDRQAFEYVLDALDVNARDVHFFDDAPINVEAARELGLNAYHTPGFDSLRTELERLGFSR